MKKEQDLIKKLPKWIKLKKEPHKCPHCSGQIYSHEKVEIVTAFGPNIQYLKGFDMWRVGYNSEYFKDLDFEGAILLEVLQTTLDYIEKNKKDLRPQYK